MEQPGFALAPVLPQAALTGVQAANTMEPAAALLAIAIEAALPAHALKMVAVMAQIRVSTARLKACHWFGSSACVAARRRHGNDQTSAAQCLRCSRYPVQIEPPCLLRLDESFQFQAQSSALHHW